MFASGGFAIWLHGTDAEPASIDRDRLARFGPGHLEAALSAHGRKVVVAGPGETTGDLVRDMIEVLTSMCGRLYGRRGARNRAMRAITATRQEPGTDG